MATYEFSATPVALTAGEEVVLSAEELRFAHTQELAKELKKALAGRGGYVTEWPKTRKQRGKPRRNPPSASTWTVQARKRRSTILVGNKQRHARLIERRQPLRGYHNKHHEAALRTIQKNWDLCAGVSFSRAVRRASSNRVRRFHAQERAAQRTAGYSRMWGAQ